MTVILAVFLLACVFGGLLWLAVVTRNDSGLARVEVDERPWRSK